MKILYTATVLSHICQFHLPHLKRLREAGHQIHIAAHDNLAKKNGLKLQHFDVFHEVPFQRSPFKWRNLTAYKRLKALLGREQYHLIICNTPMGGIITRLAAQKSRELGSKVIYMAHGFHFYKGAPLRNWLLYYPVEKWMARYCDTLVTITAEDYTFAKRHFDTNVEHIHGIGVSQERFHPVDDFLKHKMRAAEHLSDSDFVILCVGELNKNKNQQLLLNAASLLKNELPSLKILLAGNGPLELELKSQVETLGLQGQVHFLGYRTDLETITPAVDLVVSCSKREGLPLNILEGMLCAKPIIATNNRGHRELVVPNESGFIIASDNCTTLAEKISLLASKPRLAKQLGAVGYQRIQNYTLNSVNKAFNKIVRDAQ